ncbi:MAG: P-loop NTPase fold protein, partial [Chloroflexota bacterium]
MTYQSDKPLNKPENDQLGYANFAQNIAQAIGALDPEDGFVIGLYGAWGSGKSTVIQFVKYYLKEVTYEDNFIIVEFNPWWFSGR